MRKQLFILFAFLSLFSQAQFPVTGLKASGKRFTVNAPNNGGSDPTPPAATTFYSHQYGDELYDYAATPAIPDDLNYKAFAVMAKTQDGYIYRYVTAKNRHWGTGWVQLHRSLDAKTWTPVAGFNSSGFGNVQVNGEYIYTGIPTIGAIGNRIIIGWNVPFTEGAGYQTGSYQWMDYAYSDNGGATWTYAGRVMSEYGDVGSSQKGIAAYGRMQAISATELIQPVYVWDYALNQFKVILHRSTNSGVTWSAGPTIISRNGEEVNETWVEPVEIGASSATTKLIAITRSEVVAGIPKWYQSYSNNGGQSWTETGTIIGTENTDNTWPIAMFRIGQTLYRIEGVRYGDYTGHRNFYTGICSMPASQYNTMNWGPVRIVTRPIAEYKGKNPQDFGYNEMQTTPADTIHSIYDESPFFRPGTDEYKRHRIIIAKALGNYRYEAYTTTSQSGALSFSTRHIDSDLMQLNDLDGGTYSAELVVNENVSVTLNGTTGSRRVFTTFSNAVISASSAGSVTGARIKVKKHSATPVGFQASGSVAVSGGVKTEIPITTIAIDTAAQKFRDVANGFTVLPYEGDYVFEVSSNTTGNIIVEVSDWGMGNSAGAIRYTQTLSANDKTLLIDGHTGHHVRVYAQQAGGGTVNCTLKITRL